MMAKQTRGDRNEQVLLKPTGTRLECLMILIHYTLLSHFSQNSAVSGFTLIPDNITVTR